MKKTIFKLILAFIFVFGTYFYYSPTEAKALSVDDITSIDDLRGTKWVLKSEEELNALNEIEKITFYTIRIQLAIAPTSEIMFASYKYSNNTINMISSDFSVGGDVFRFGGFGIDYFTLKTTNIIAVNNAGVTYFSDTNDINYGIEPRELIFGNWEDGTLNFVLGNIDYFLSNLQKIATLDSSLITFNLAGGTTAEPLDDITYIGSYTINPDELPTPTYEYMSNNVWLTEQIEYSNYFRGWAYSTDDGDTYYWFNDGVPHTFTDEDVIIRAYWEEINWVPIKIFTQSVEPSNDLIVFATPYLDDTLTISIDFTLYSKVKLTISGYQAPPYSFIASDRFNEVVSVTNNDTSTIIELNLLGTDIDYMVFDKYDGAELTELLNITEEEMSELKYGSSSKTITFDVDLTSKGENTIITAYIIPESSVIITPPEDNWVINAFGTFFLLVESILNLQLGFITLGHIIGLLLSVAVIGFIFKVWNGANNG